MLTDNNHLMKELNVYSYRLHFTIEPNEMIDSIISGYEDLLYNGIPFMPKQKYTTGHIKRGVE